MRPNFIISLIALLRNGNQDVSHLERAMQANAEMDERQGSMGKVIEIRLGGDQPQACRFWGSVPLHKVAGNFHIMPGKAIPHPMGHAHMNFFGAENVNFRFTNIKFS